MEIDNKKLVKYLKDKDVLVKQGRSISGQIERIEGKIKKCESKEKKITMKVQPVELGEKVDKLKDEINRKIKLFEKLSNKIRDEKLKAIPEKLEIEHKELMAKREKLERERNKIALKVQKIKDRCVPIIQKEVKPLLGEYDDIETADVKGDKVVIKTFNHLEDWKKAFEKRQS